MSAFDVDGLNAGYARALLDEYLENPEAVPSEWRSLFESGDSELVATHPGLVKLLETLQTDGNGASAETAPPPAPATAAEPADDVLLGGVAAAMALVKAHRMHGHLAAKLDPLGSEAVGDPALEPERLEPPLTPELQARIPARYLRLYVPGETLADALPALRETYCGTIAYEIEHISDHEERVWLRQAIESGRYRQPLSAEEKRSLLERLTEVQVFERYLQRAFLGQKQFSIEGLDSLVPLLDETVELAAETGTHRIVLGMAHRGRLNVIVHTLGLPYEYVLVEFEGERTIDAVVSDPEGGTGDVKYHLGADATRSTRSGEIQLTLASNPSHLEAVDPVVEGMTRAEQTDRGTRKGLADPSVGLPVLIHGDAAFPAQGVVAETLNLQALRGYSTGGTLHVIANNQVGFTTDPGDARSTRHSSDLAKGFDVPIIHVNSDDPEAALSAARLATAFRRRFCHDVVIDLVGYRRHGHNEQDEAAYTQPLMAQLIARHPPVRELYAKQLVEEGVLTDDEAQQLVGVRGSEAEGRPRAASRHDRQAGARARRADPALELRSRDHCGRSGPAPRAEQRAPDGARGLHRAPEADEAAAATRRGTRCGRHRLGARRGACVRVTPRRGHPDQADRSGHRARHVLTSAHRSARRGERRRLLADPAPARRQRVVRGVQLAALRVRSASVSSTATRSPRPRRSCSGRRSSVTSSTARRSRSTSSSSPASRSGARRRG